MTVKQITSDFVDRAGTDGVHDVKRSKSWWAKSIWILLLAVAWTFVVLQVIAFIKKYFSYPVNTKVELKFDDSSTFPVISICNLNPVKQSQAALLLEASEGLDEILKQAPHHHDSMMKGGWSDTMTNHDNLAEKFKIDYETMADYYYDSDEVQYWSPDMHPEEILMQDNFYNQYFKLSADTKEVLGHKIEDMLLECTWKEKQCFPTDFTHFLHPIYGNCYSFNSGWKLREGADSAVNVSIYRTNMPGPTEGLSMQLFAEGDEYLPLLASSTGVRVLVHAQASPPPHPEDTGFTLAAGFATALEIRKVSITRLELPYNNEDCKDVFTQFQEGISKFWPRANYTMTTCMKLCYQRELHTDCNCVDPQGYFYEDASEVRACNMSDTTDGLCKKKFDEKFRRATASTKCSSDCPQPCNEVDFEVQISSAQWPNRYYLDILKETTMQRSSQFNAMGEEHQHQQQQAPPGMHEEMEAQLDDKIGRNVLKLDVYYQSLNYKLIFEEEAYLLVDLLADIGGAIDLWVGMSVLAAVQVFEYFFELLFYLCCKKGDQRPDTKDSSVYPITPDQTDKNMATLYEAQPVLY